MKHNLKAFNSAVKYYKQHLRPYKTILIVGKFNEKAFYSMAPLSRAVHELNSDLNVMLYSEKPRAFKALLKVWNAYDNLKEKRKTKSTKLLSQFILEVEKKAKGEFEKIFERPELILGVSENGFSGEVNLAYHPNWHKPYRSDELLETARNIWKDVYNLKKSEKVGIGFELMPKKIDLPFNDYLDSYSICYAMIRGCPSKRISVGSSTLRNSALDFPERISELKATILGCELEKDIDEKIFRTFKKLSRLLKLSCFKPNDATFSIHGKGYGGKHIFGETIGYPTANRKSRWPGPGGIIYKFDWYLQAKDETRKPRCRVAFTETLPIDIFVDTCNIDFKAMRLQNNKISRLIEKSDQIRVESNKTNLTVQLVGKGIKRLPKGSDSDARFKINPLIKKRKNMETGMMANLPGGESFLTPEYIEGTFYGDVVIAIDQSYVLSEKNPIIVKCSKKGYEILSGPGKILALIKKKKAEEWKQLLKFEKTGAIPSEVINTSKKNFEGIGEFAINTNPKARLCRYLIVNEKIAGMIHIALGSGFDPDKETEYHYDIVINAKKQKLNIYGVAGRNKYWIMKAGRLLY